MYRGIISVIFLSVYIYTFELDKIIWIISLGMFLKLDSGL